MLLLIKNFLLFFIIIIFQILMPSIAVFHIEITPDLILILIVYLGYFYKRFEAIILSFFLGFIQDLSTQLSLIGIMTFNKTIIGYFFASISLYHSIWNKYFRYSIIFFLFFIHFIIYYYIKYNNIEFVLGSFFGSVIFHSCLCYILLFIIDKIIMNNILSK